MSAIDIVAAAGSAGTGVVSLALKWATNAASKCAWDEVMSRVEELLGRPGQQDVRRLPGRRVRGHWRNGRYVRGYASQPGPGMTRARHPAPAARGLLAAAARVMPAGSRGRYLEEFRAELYDLAAAGAGSWLQLRYSARLVIHVVSLARTVRAPSRRRAAP